jgi:hypothetical protein
MSSPEISPTEPEQATVDALLSLFHQSHWRHHKTELAGDHSQQQLLLKGNSLKRSIIGSDQEHTAKKPSLCSVPSWNEFSDFYLDLGLEEFH